MRLSAARSGYLLRCDCRPANLALSGREVVFDGRVTCRACGRSARWRDLIDAGEIPEGGAEFHHLRL